MVGHRHDTVDPVCSRRRPFSWRQQVLFAVGGAAVGSSVNFLLSHGDVVTTVAYGGTFLFLSALVTTARVIWRRTRPL